MFMNNRTIYRYRAFSIYTLDSLCHDTLHFSRPETFNDPLDCRPSLKSDSALNELRELFSLLLRKRVRSEVLVSLKHARVKKEGAAAHAERRAEVEAGNGLARIAYLASDPDYTLPKEKVEETLLLSAIKDELLKHYDRGVCCFSSSYKSPLLWSHYGDQHRGLCIGYGLDRRPKPDLHSVVYGGERVIRTSVLMRALLTDDIKAKEELDSAVLLRKARQWSYEKEYRLLGCQGIQPSPLLLKEVTFGLRCPASVIHAVAQSLNGRDPAIKYFRMGEVPGRYSLRRINFDPSELRMDLPNIAQSAEEALDGFADVEPE